MEPGFSQPLDRAALADQLRARVETLRVTFDLFRVLTLKELHRRNDVEAIAFSHGWTLRPLIEALRIRYKPARHSFYTRYIHYDLPQAVVRELQDLFFVRDADDLWAKRERAERWFYETLEGIEQGVDRLPAEAPEGLSPSEPLDDPRGVSDAADKVVNDDVLVWRVGL